MSVKVISNFPQKAAEFRAYANKLGNKVMKEAMFGALEMIGNTAVDQFMKQTHVDFMKSAPTGFKLRIRTGRLAQSISNVMNFSGSTYAATIKKYAKAGASSPAAGKKESIREVNVTGKNIEGIIGSEVEYAAIHEFGGKAGRGLSVNIKKRPYITPAIKESMPDIHSMFNELIHESFNREHI